jgi:hypothetical protein
VQHLYVHVRAHCQPAVVYIRVSGYYFVNIDYAGPIKQSPWLLIYGFLGNICVLAAKLCSYAVYLPFGSHNTSGVIGHFTYHLTVLEAKDHGISRSRKFSLYLLMLYIQLHQI